MKAHLNLISHIWETDILEISWKIKRWKEVDINIDAKFNVNVTYVLRCVDILMQRDACLKVQSKKYLCYQKSDYIDNIVVCFIN